MTARKWTAYPRRKHSRQMITTPSLQGVRSPLLPTRRWTQSDTPAENEYSSSIIAQLRAATGVDFSQYRSGILNRRIARRMALCKIGSFERYAQYLKGNPKELDALFQDLLIHVTSFFREPKTFEI